MTVNNLKQLWYYKGKIYKFRLCKLFKDLITYNDS